jgi:hypothetical protein
MFVGLVEYFDESLMLLRKKCIDRPLNILYHSKHVASKNAIKNQLMSDSKTRKHLEEANRVDLLLYDFAKAELYEKYRIDYGGTLDLDVLNFRMLNSRFIDINGKLLLQFLKRRLFYRPVLFCYRLSAGSSMQKVES